MCDTTEGITTIYSCSHPPYGGQMLELGYRKAVLRSFHAIKVKTQQVLYCKNVVFFHIMHGGV